MRFILISFLIFVVHNSLALDQVNTKLNNYAKACPEKTSRDLKSLVNYLSKGGNTQTQQVELFCYWIAENISYDTESYVSGKTTETAKILVSRKGVCQNYAELLQKMCESVQIECHIVSGYSKGYGYSKKKPFQSPDHAWNIVKVDGKYLFVDATWSCGYVDQVKGSLMFFKELKIEEIFADPNYFLMTHLPGDPRWQIRNNPITMTSFTSNDSVKDMLKLTLPNYNYLDSLKTYLAADSLDRRVMSAISTYNFNPINANLTEVGDAYYNKAWKTSQNTNDIKNYETAIIWYDKSIMIFSKLNNTYGAKWISNSKKGLKYCTYQIDILKKDKK
ncbi:transglutaminase domain-containing protein [Fluviicola taffensis]|uniref:Transglutaminase domain-containing protein n=1 Tax=Fluviicola taffensis (strain DSM 16823 / NCIMB 13979 / RW262) TaxID=755732 RepID=F2IIT1_FLUTR|nr:transglutaminase domain-containing protein [Fluviicola taffensis]AEA42788.1 transglutaminase domain-containing protein [Fluviicola taffensis DSM 16823]